RIGGKPGHGALHLRCRPLIEGCEAQHALLPKLKLIDVRARNADLDIQHVIGRNDQHQLLGRIDHAANSMDAELMNDSVDRSPEFDPLQLVLRRNLSLLQLCDATLSVAQFLLRIGKPVLIDSNDLQSRLRDLAASFGNLCQQRPDLPFNASLVALEAEDASDRNQVLLVKLINAQKLLPDQQQFAG